MSKETDSLISGLGWVTTEEIEIILAYREHMKTKSEFEEDERS